MINKNQPVLHLSAEHMSPEEQFEALRISAEPITDLQTERQMDIKNFRAESTWYLLDNILISQSSSSALQYNRNKKKIAQHDDLEHYIFHLSLQGSYTGVSGQHDLRSDKGSITVMDTREQIYGQSSDCRLLSVVIPRHLLQNANLLQSMTIAKNSVKTRVLGEHMLSLWNAIPEMDVADNPVFSQGLIALTNALFSSDGNGQNGDGLSLDKSLLASMKNNINMNLSSTQLGTASLCRDFCCSRSTLYRLFQPCGGVAQYIRERRLVAAFKVLSESSMTNRRIIDVAIQHGFSNQSIFSRLFRQHFGVTPSEVAMLRKIHPLQSSQQSQTARQIAHWLTSI